MNFIKEVKIIKNILKNYNEDFILFSNIIEVERLILKKNRKNKEHFFKKNIIFILILTGHISKYILKILIFLPNLSFKNDIKNSEIGFFCGSYNQFKALKKLIKNCESNKKIYINNRNLIKYLGKEINYKVVEFDIRSIILMFIFIILRIKHFYRNIIKFDSCTYKFLVSLNNTSYLWLSKYLREFEKVKMKLLILSNSNSRGNICLILACQALDLKTTYIQHSSVTKRFPPLLCNFNFLDGEYSYSIFKKLEKDFLPKTKYKRMIFLTGITTYNKRIIRKFDFNKKNIGFCISKADSIDKVISDSNFCIKLGFKVILRLHPRESVIRTHLINEYINNKTSVSMHNAKDLDLEDFFRNIFCCISCSSGVQIEAAIANIVNLYRPWNLNEDDRYNFIKNGISIRCNNKKKLKDYIFLSKENKISIKDELIRYYSHSYGGEFFGKETEKIILIIKQILKNSRSKLKKESKSYF